MTVDDSGNWFWSYEKLQWFQYTPPVDVDDPPEQQSKEKEEEEDGHEFQHFGIVKSISTFNSYSLYHYIVIFKFLALHENCKK